MVDIVGPLPVSRGMRYMLTIVDRTTRWMEALPMKDATSGGCCTAFLEGWISKFGIPGKVTSDNGPAFQAKLWQDINHHSSAGEF